MIPRVVEIAIVVQATLFDVRQNPHRPIVPITAARQAAVSLVVHVQCQAQLVQVVFALHVPRGFASRLNARHQQPDQNANDRDHHK